MKRNCGKKKVHGAYCPKYANLMVFEQDVGFRQVFNILVSTLQLLLQLSQPLLHVGQALVEKLRAVGVKQQPRLLLGGGLQFVPQLVEFGQLLCHNWLKLWLGLHQLLTLLYSQKHRRKKGDLKKSPSRREKYCMMFYTL